MKFHRNFVPVLLSLLTIPCLTTSAQAQNLNGKAKIASNEVENVKEVNVSYGNVVAYDRNNKVVESVLTDEKGNYNIQFKDTGTYIIKVKYAGFEAVEEKVVVDKQEVVNDFQLKRDETQKKRELSKHAYSMMAGFVDGGVYLSSNNAQKHFHEEGKGLTAGEINDFSKWDMWNDYLEKDLATFQSTWKINPQQRYSVLLVNEDRSALVGADVHLYDKSKRLLWHAKTDNIGKAELWGNIGRGSAEVDKIVVYYKDEVEEIQRPIPFEKGINVLEMDEACGAENVVEIVFVVDATGSMMDEINFIKRDLNTVMFDAQNTHSDVLFRYGSVFYRDKTEDYITKHKDFTDVLSEALVYVDEQFAKGGGDMPEAVDDGLEVAINQLSWTNEARSKLLFLILDAPAHSRPENIEKLERLTKEAAQKGIKIIPITGSGINKSGEYLMRALALGTNGTYMFLTDHSGIGRGHIKPSVDEYDVQLLTKRMSDVIKNNVLYIECDDTIPEVEAEYPDSVVYFTLEEGQVDGPDVLPDSLKTNRDTLDRDSSIVEPPKQIEWRYYPNPTRDYVTVESPEEIKFIYLTDMSGKILQKVDFVNNRSVRLYLGDYPVGVYLLRYPIGKQWVTGKVVKIR